MTFTIEEPEFTERQKRLFVFGLVLIVMVFYGASIAHFYYTPDETYRYLQYARNISQGHGFSFNPGEPSFGVASPLWTLLISCEYFFSIDVVMSTKVLDLFTASIGLVIFFLLSFEILRHRILALLSTLVFSMNVSFLQWASSGLESSLAVSLAVLTVWCCLRNEYIIGSFIAGVLALVRPEAILLIIVIGADIFFNTIDRRRGVNKLISSLLVCAVIVVPWYGYAYLTFGTVVPNTLFAENGAQGGTGVLAAYFNSIGVPGMVEGLLFLVGLILSMRNSIRHTMAGRAELRMLILPAGWIAILSVFFLGYGIGTPSRLLVPIVPFITILGFWGVKKIHEEYGFFQRFDYTIFIILSAIVLIQHQIVYRYTVQPHMRNVAQGTEEVFQSIASWLETNTAKDAIVTVPDVGVIGYYSQRRIWDPSGVITPEVMKLRRKGCSYDDIMVKKLYNSYCFPDYVIDRASVAERLTDDDLLPLFHRTFYGMPDAMENVLYYTVYKVRHATQQKAFLNKN